jgi:predicted MFS family arabinose efflux permease
LEPANFTDHFAFRSLVCATAQSSTALVIGRAIAGAGVSGVFTGSIMVVVRCGKSFGEFYPQILRR